MDGNWFYEKDEAEFPGQRFGLQVDKVLVDEKTKYQDLLIFQSTNYGRVMVLDGMINSTSRDECAYQEMITFLPLNSHPSPKKVLIIGGGDGGVARECVKHPLVESVLMVEIDDVLVEASKKFLPDMAIGMSHPKVTLHIGDGLAYLQNNMDKYDVIIADLSDPEGPAEKLFQETFYKLMNERLNDDGIICCQGECIWLDLELIVKMLSFCRGMYPSVSYAFNGVPTYTCGSIGYVICSKAKDKQFKEPVTIFSEEEKEKMKLNFYDEDIHRAAFALPRFARKKFKL